MKQIIGILLALTSLSGMLKAQPADSVRIEDLRMERNGNYLTIQMNVVLTSVATARCPDRTKIPIGHPKCRTRWPTATLCPMRLG